MNKGKYVQMASKGGRTRPFAVYLIHVPGGRNNLLMFWWRIMRLRHLDTFRLLFESVRNVFFIYLNHFILGPFPGKTEESWKEQTGARCAENIWAGSLLG